MCLGTFSRLRRSLATSTLYVAVRIPAERFLLYRKAISCKVKKQTKTAVFWRYGILRNGSFLFFLIAFIRFRFRLHRSRSCSIRHYRLSETTELTAYQ